MPDIVEDPELRSGRAPPPHSGQARWLCCALLTYRPGYSSSLAPRQRAWGPAAKCEFISARALRASGALLLLASVLQAAAGELPDLAPQVRSMSPLGGRAGETLVVHVSGKWL